MQRAFCALMFFWIDTFEPFAFAGNEVLCHKNSVWITHHPPLFISFLFFCESSRLQKIMQAITSGQEHMAGTLRFTVWQTAFSTLIQTSLMGRRSGYHGDSKQEAAGVLEAWECITNPISLYLWNRQSSLHTSRRGSTAHNRMCHNCPRWVTKANVFEGAVENTMIPW